MAVKRQVEDVRTDTSTSPVPSEAVAPVEVGVGDSPAAELISDDSRGPHYAAGHEPSDTDEK